jgi:hypothetical protein
MNMRRQLVHLSIQSFYNFSQQYVQNLRGNNKKERKKEEKMERKNYLKFEWFRLFCSVCLVEFLQWIMHWVDICQLLQVGEVEQVDSFTSDNRFNTLRERKAGGGMKEKNTTTKNVDLPTSWAILLSVGHWLTMLRKRTGRLDASL